MGMSGSNQNITPEILAQLVETTEALSEVRAEIDAYTTDRTAAGEDGFYEFWRALGKGWGARVEIPRYED